MTAVVTSKRDVESRWFTAKKQFSSGGPKGPAASQTWASRTTRIAGPTVYITEHLGRVRRLEFVVLGGVLVVDNPDAASSGAEPATCP